MTTMALEMMKQEAEWRGADFAYIKPLRGDMMALMVEFSNGNSARDFAEDVLDSFGSAHVSCDGSFVMMWFDDGADPEPDQDCEPDPGDLDGDHGSALASCGWGTDEDYGDFGNDEF